MLGNLWWWGGALAYYGLLYMIRCYICTALTIVLFKHGLVVKLTWVILCWLLTFSCNTKQILNPPKFLVCQNIYQFRHQFHLGKTHNLEVLSCETFTILWKKQKFKKTCSITKYPFSFQVICHSNLYGISHWPFLYNSHQWYSTAIYQFQCICSMKTAQMHTYPAYINAWIRQSVIC